MLGSNRVPVVLQSETNECGLACLCMILNYHGNHVDLPVLRHQYPGDKPLSLEQLTTLSNAYDLQSRALRCEPADLNQINLPAVLHMDFDHYVVLEKVNQRYFTILDPARGRLRLSAKAFSDRFTGIVLELQKAAGFEKTGERKSYSPFSIFAQLPLSSITKPLVLLFALSLCVQALALVAPFFLQVMVDEVFMANNLELASVVIMGFAGVYLVSALTQWFRGLLIIHLGNQLSYLMAAGLLNRLISLPSRFFRRRSVGDIVSRFSSMKPLQDFITHSATIVLLDVLMISTTLLMLACYAIEAAVFVMIAVTVFVVIQYWLMIPFRSHSHEQIIADARVQTHFIETVQSIETIKRYEAEQRRTTDWLNRLTVSINAQIRASRYQLLLEIGRYLLAGLTLLGVVYLSIDNITAATLTIGMLYAMVSYTHHLTSAVLSLVSEWQRFLMLALHVQRLTDIVNTPTDDRSTIESVNYPRGIKIQHLTFRYDNAGPALINDLNLTITAGDKIAVLGPSGSGKSTLFNLLLGEEQPTAGEICIDDRPLTATLRPHQAYSTIFQTDQLLSGTVTENITFTDPVPDQQRLLDSTRLACIHEDILRLPLSYQEKISENGHSLSAGQRQRLLIARALYRRADILLLDEGTCHLDERTEHQVMQNILAGTRTCIYITHRDSIARLADRVIRLGPSVSHQSFAAS